MAVLQLQKRLNNDDGDGADYAPILDRDDVEVEAIPDAAACGAAGCRRVEHLIRVTIAGFGTRVLCPDHASDLLKRETARG